MTDSFFQISSTSSKTMVVSSSDSSVMCRFWTSPILRRWATSSSVYLCMISCVSPNSLYATNTISFILTHSRRRMLPRTVHCFSVLSGNLIIMRPLPSILTTVPYS